MKAPGAKRAERKRDVRDHLLIHGPTTLMGLCLGTGYTPAAVSTALRDIRNDPAYEYGTVATKGGGYLYQIAVTVAETLNGLINQEKHNLTRAESKIAAGQKLTKIAVTPDDYAIAAEITASGKMAKAQSEALLKALGR